MDQGTADFKQKVRRPAAPSASCWCHVWGVAGSARPLAEDPRGSREIEAVLDRNDKQEITEATGDLMFALVNLAGHVDADPEAARRAMNARFEKRFAFIE